MKRILVIIAIVTLAPLLAAPAAEAGMFSVGAAFNVGGLFFDLGFGGPRYSPHASHHVYRVNKPFHYAGYPCHAGCYRDAGYTYHHADCPAVAVHFRSYGFSPYASYPAFFVSRSYGGYRTYGSYYRPYTYRDHQYRGFRRYRDHRVGHGHFDHRRRDRSRDHGFRGHRHDHRRPDAWGHRHDGGRHRHHIDRSDRRREETRGSDRGRGSRRRDAGSTRSRDRSSRRP